MKKYLFRLQVVLDRAVAEEEEQLLHLARIRREIVAKEQEIAINRDAHAQLLQHMARLQASVFDPRDLLVAIGHQEALANDVTRLRSERDAIDRRIAQQQHCVMEAMRKRQLLDKLREKQLDEYRREVDQPGVADDGRSRAATLGTRASHRTRATCRRIVYGRGQAPLCTR